MENGSIINQYKILSAIGRGGMGEVLLAQDTKLDRKVALKILPSEFAEDKDRMNRFVREAKSASALNHPNIITIHEIGECGTYHFIAAEFIEGETLRQHFTCEDQSLKSTLDIAIQIASALDAAHRAGIIHRDLKPDNVMIRHDGFVKLLDFGVAKLNRLGNPDSGFGNEDKTLMQSAKETPRSAIPDPKLTAPGLVIGTASYMSPEQAKGKEVDSRTDIFSFGVVLYEIIDGDLPFEGENALEMIGSILKDEPRSLNSNVPGEIAKIIGKCLRKDREERYQSIKDVLIDLQDIKQELEFQNKLERTDSPHKAEMKTQSFRMETLGAINQTTTNQTFLKYPKYIVIGLLILILAVSGFFGYRYIATAPSKQIDSIAVMPFVNAGGNADHEYLSDGLTESLINSLSRLPGLAVKAPSTVFRYKGKDVTSQQIGSELLVQAVLNGRVTQRGDQITVSLDLVKAGTGDQIWGQQYTRKVSDLVSLQAEIANEISQKLRTNVSPEDRQKLVKGSTTNPEAYQLYLKGNYFVSRFTKEGRQKAFDYFNQAIAADPDYALAHCGLAYYYLLEYLPPREAMPKARDAAKKALAIDETQAAAHAYMAVVSYYYDWDWTAAERGFKRAIELDPNEPRLHLTYSLFLVTQGRGEEAVAEATRGQQLDPLSTEAGQFLGIILKLARRYDEAIEVLQKTVELDDTSFYSHKQLGDVYKLRGRLTEAQTESRRAVELEPSDPEALAWLGSTCAVSGKKAEALKIIESLKERSATEYIPPLYIALVYAGLGDKDQAFAWLDRAYVDRTMNLIALTVEPEWDPIRSDPRFMELVKKVGLPQ